MLNKKGFTLVELIVVIAIIGILSSILVPSIMGYVNLARKKATVSNAKVIYDAVAINLATDDEVYDAFYYYSKQNAKKNKVSVGCGTMFEATADGVAVKDTTSKGYDNGKAKKYQNYVKLSNPSHYLFTVVARVDGKSHKYGGGYAVSHIYNTFSNSDPQGKYTLFLNALNDHIGYKATKYRGNTKGDFPIKMPYNGRDDDGEYPLIRWLVVYRIDNPEIVEIWAGDGTKAENGPVYRVYPNPNKNYA